MAYKFFDKVYKDWDTMLEGVMADFPVECHSSDAMVDFIENNIETVEDESDKCWVCGDRFNAFTTPFLRDKGVCSNRCLEDGGWDYS